MYVCWKIIVFGGDFRQILPAVRSRKREDFVRENLLYLDIWNQPKKLCLSENTRVKYEPTFCEYLMCIEMDKK